MGFLLSLFGGIWLKLIAVLALVGGGIGAVWKIRRDAVKLDRAKQEEIDRERANSIRMRVRNLHIERMRKHDNTGYRDED